MSRHFSIVAALLLVVGCSAKKMPFDPSSMVAPSPEAELEYKENLTIEEIEALEPQLGFPIRLAISQPSSGSGWSAQELDVIEAWEAPLVATGFIDSLVVLPESLSEACGWRMAYHCGIARDRKTASRFRADALLLISMKTDLKSYASPLSILNLTVVGLWTVPAHHRRATTVLEGALIDNRNEYLYAFARATGQAKLVRPYIFADWKKASSRSRLLALRTFGDRMHAELREQGTPERARHPQ